MNTLTGILNPYNLFCFAGLLVFARWLLQTSLARTALDDSPARPNIMDPIMVLVIFLIWTMLPSLLLSALGSYLNALGQWQKWFAKNAIMAAASIFTIIIVLFCVSRAFTMGLKGFGLGIKRIYRDFISAVVILFCIWPLVLVMISVSTYAGKFFVGPDYEITQHKELKVLTDNSQLESRIMVVVLAVLIAPLIEEILFRGLLQSLIRSYLNKPWLAIGMSSAAFALIHVDNPGHWFALFVLAVGMGYAYEKSGSLWQSIFIHVLFNAAAVVSSLCC